MQAKVYSDESEKVKSDKKSKAILKELNGSEKGNRRRSSSADGSDSSPDKGSRKRSSTEELAAEIERQKVQMQRPRPVKILDYWNEKDFDLRMSFPEEVQMLHRYLYICIHISCVLTFLC